jgi:hypothetical protein
MNRLNAWSLSLIVSAAALAAACAPAAMAATANPPAAHAHDEAHPARLALDHGRKWGTDPALRAGMGRIRGLVAPRVGAAHSATMGAADHAALAAKVEVEVGNIVANCKLAPEADAMLHIVLSELTSGTAAMAGRTPGVSAQQGFVQVLSAINDYGRFFDDPRFQAIRTSH